MPAQVALHVAAESDPGAYAERMARWLARREAENSYILGILPELAAAGPKDGLRLVTVQEDHAARMAAVIFPNGALCMTWADVEEIETLVDYLLDQGIRIQHVHGPGPAARHLAGLYAHRTGGRNKLVRAERVYQLTDVEFDLPADGRLERATAADRPLALAWLEAFAAETALEMGGRSIEPLADALLAERRLFLWKRPEPSAMAVWVAPLARTAAINYVYTPPHLRGRGHAKAVSAALGKRMLASGLASCLILSDANDARTRTLYQSIGAQAICECARYAIVVCS